MTNAIEALRVFVNDSNRLFAQYHGPHICKTITDSFLDSRMEEARQHSALSCAEEILNMTDIEDGLHFGKYVQRREVSGEIMYPKQRDHSAHALYNYILGFYIFSNVKDIATAMMSEFKNRYGTTSPQRFCNIWPYASMLHDVGYILEGSLEPLSTDSQEAHIRRGAMHVHEYFKHRFWIVCKLGAMYDRDHIQGMTGVSIPAFDDLSISGVADSLRRLSDLEGLRVAADEDRQSRSFEARQPDHLGTIGGLPPDAFLLWQRNYEYYGSPKMSERVRLAEDFFEYVMYEGFGGSGIRLLDHGICSGLILLQYSTFFFNLLANLPKQCPSGMPQETYNRFVHAMIGAYALTNISYNPLWWWASVVWATSATALHSVMQNKHMGPPAVHAMPSLKLEQDPLTYLGILSDTLQQWDRMEVSRHSIVSGTTPVQGTDVELWMSNGKVNVDYHSSRISRDVVEELDRALADWPQYVVVQ